MKLCAVIPAAGRGSRLGADLPKILVKVADGVSVWDILWHKLTPIVDHIHVILSPSGRPLFEAAITSSGRTENVSVSVQPEPRGMGDAIFKGQSVWAKAESALLIWGDQIHISSDTLERCKEAHFAHLGLRVTLPVVSLADPYVEYIFNDEGQLARVLQSREGDRCRAGGLSDVGTFFLSTERLDEAWRGFIGSTEKGTVTGEVNFLPFLVLLSASGWRFQTIPVENPHEARGINSPEDLAFFRRLYGDGTGVR